MPFAGTFHMEKAFVGIFPQPFFDAICNGFHLRTGIPGTKYEIIYRGIIQMSQIQFEYFFAFYGLYTVNDQGV